MNARALSPPAKAGLTVVLYGLLVLALYGGLEVIA